MEGTAQPGQLLDPSATSAADPRAAAADAAARRFQQAQAAAPVTASPVTERARLLLAREKLNKLLVSSIMDYGKNSVSAAAACIGVLTTLVANVLEQPGNEKVRQVSTNSKIFAAKVLPVSGGEAFLVEAGWYRRTLEHASIYIYGHDPDSYHWRLLEVALDELRKAGCHADDKVERMTSASVSRSKAAEDALERERIKLQIRGDKATRKDKFVYN